MIKVICIGKIKEKYLDDLIKDYEKRISKYHKIEIIELKEEKTIEDEGNSILKQIKEKDFVIAMDINGKNLNSVELSNLIEETFINYPGISFIIGSSEGLSSKVKEKANLLLSFSQLTFPHGLFRGILLEQIYRSFKIINNEIYHK